MKKERFGVKLILKYEAVKFIKLKLQIWFWIMFLNKYKYGSNRFS